MYMAVYLVKSVTQNQKSAQCFKGFFFTIELLDNAGVYVEVSGGFVGPPILTIKG